jgi:ABC-type uncharacterized transport system permease subunit
MLLHPSLTQKVALAEILTAVLIFLFLLWLTRAFLRSIFYHDEARRSGQPVSEEILNQKFDAFMYKNRHLKWGLIIVVAMVFIVILLLEFCFPDL